MNSHICHVITSLSVGGAEQYVVQLSNYLQTIGNRVSIVAGEPHLIRERLDSSIHVKTLQMHPGTTRSALIYIRIFFPAVRHLVAYFRQERVTVVHTHLTASALPAWIAAKICGIPVIHSKMYTAVHGSRFERVLFASRLPVLLVSRFLAFTRYTEDEINEYWHAPRERILASSIGVDTTRFCVNPEVGSTSRAELGLSANDNVMLVVSRLHPEKDVELAIRAALGLDAPGSVLLIAGDGPQRKYLEKLVKDIHSQTKIRFLGSLQDTRPAYAAANLLLQTTRGPNLGVVVLEAMASGLPVLIAYRDEAERKMAADTLDGLDIGAIAEASPKAMTTKLREVFENPARLQGLSTVVRSFVEGRHAQSKVYPAMAKYYSALERCRIENKKASEHLDSVLID